MKLDVKVMLQNTMDNESKWTSIGPCVYFSPNDLKCIIDLLDIIDKIEECRNIEEEETEFGSYINIQLAIQQPILLGEMFEIRNKLKNKKGVDNSMRRDYNIIETSVYPMVVFFDKEHQSFRIVKISDTNYILERNNGKDSMGEIRWVEEDDISIEYIVIIMKEFLKIAKELKELNHS